ncbi:MAG: helix-turn-helix domain-containing protein [Candidatus Dojkabacteria bacterium]|nr:helix-turn-helix domain-containing protein [Candidatus Dojkabacteria bacterium]
MDRPIEVLEKYGLSKDEAGIYLYLLTNGTKTITELRKGVSKGRTKITRLLENLTNKDLVKEIKDESGRYFRANSYENLKKLLQDQKEKIEQQRAILPEIFKELEKFGGKMDRFSKVLHYTGLVGLKQVMWNSSKAKGKLRLVEEAGMSAYLDYGFYERIREEYVKNKVKCCELTNLKKMPGFTDIEKFVKSHWEARYIDARNFNAKFELMIYNDVYALYNATEQGIFCVEIHNRKLARMQKRIFDFMWRHAQEMKVLSKHGAVRVKLGGK